MFHLSNTISEEVMACVTFFRLNTYKLQYGSQHKFIYFFVLKFSFVSFLNVLDQSKLTAEEDRQDLDLTPPLLEEAVNLLLVNKTVMSCILVLQNRRDAEKIQESTGAELPTVICAPLKVCHFTA